MRFVFRTKTPVPLFRLVLILVLSLASAYFYLSTSQKSNPSVQASITPGIPAFVTPEPQAPKPDITVKEVSIPRNSTFSDIMTSHGFDNETVHSIYEAAKEHYDLSKIRAGSDIRIEKADAEFVRLEYTIDAFDTLVVTKSPDDYRAEILTKPSETRVEEIGGYIDGSLYATLDQMGEGDELVVLFADIFEWDVDFFRDLQKGDSFRIVFEKIYLDGEPYGYGKVLAAELINRGQSYQALGYEKDGKYAFYSPDGKAMRRAFLAAPLKFSRISSGFTSRRYHPILKRNRPHYGVDYVAPAGTPVRAIGSGSIILAGWAGGAGKTVKIQHNKEIATVYCHLSGYAKGVRKGARVSQGQVIGYVGATGLATAPHLDFRFIKNGKYVNFLRVKSPQAAPLSSTEITRFQSQTAPLLGQLTRIPLHDSSPQLASSNDVSQDNAQPHDSTQGLR